MACLVRHKSYGFADKHYITTHWLSSDQSCATLRPARISQQADRICHFSLGRLSAMQYGAGVRSQRGSGDMPINPFTAGVYVATMMATVTVLREKVRRGLLCIFDWPEHARLVGPDVCEL